MTKKNSRVKFFSKFIENKSNKLIYIWLIIITCLYSLLSLVRHNRFQSGAFDLGLFDQAVWQYSRFIYPYNTIKERFILGDHLTLTLPLIAPLYWFINDVRVLLVFQAAWISFSAIAIFKLSKKRGFSGFISFCFAFVYSLFYGIQQGIFFDFHPVMLGVGLLAWLVFFLENNNKKLFLLALVLLLLTQENMGIALSCIGLIYVFKKRHQKLAVGFVLLGFITSIIQSRIIAFFSPVGFQYGPQLSLNAIKIFTDFFNSEEKRQVWFYSLSWFAFLPLLSPGAMLAVTLDLGQYFVTGPEFKRMWSPFMHHRAILSIFLILGTMEAFLLLKKWFKPIYLAIILLLTSLFVQYYYHFPLNKLVKQNYWKKEPWMEDNLKIFKLVPRNASLTSQQNLIPHLSHRKEIYLLWPRQHKVDNYCDSCWWLDFGGQPEYLLVDLHSNQWLTQLLETNENFSQAVNNMEKAGKISLLEKVNSSRLYKIVY